MDPNAALAKIRHQLTLFYVTGAEIPELGIEFDVTALADAVSGLDEWLSNKGFLPADWRLA